MPRLTRTQKYAELREQLANDKEENIASSELSSFQDRLSNVQDTLSPESNSGEEDTWTPFVDNTPVDTNQPFFAEVQIDEPTVTEIEETVEPQVENQFNNFMDNEFKEIKPVQEDSIGFNHDNIAADNRPIDEISEDVFGDVKDDSGEFVSIKERETYLNQTLSDVNSYNQINGQQTINQLVDDSVDEIRHHRIEPVDDAEFIESVDETSSQEATDNTYAWRPFTEDGKEELDADKVTVDEEFSNTVSMEISKMMDEISQVSTEDNKPEFVEVTPTNEPTATPVVEDIKVEGTVVEEKPEEVLEIKNISELEEDIAKDTMSNTIPFVVAADDEEIVEEDEDDSPNTVLNIILIVLIILLVAVLGLIVFYILKTKGIL